MSLFELYNNSNFKETIQISFWCVFCINNPLIPVSLQKLNPNQNHKLNLLQYFLEIEASAVKTLLRPKLLLSLIKKKFRITKNYVSFFKIKQYLAILSNQDNFHLTVNTTLSTFPSLSLLMDYVIMEAIFHSANTTNFVPDIDVVVLNFVTLKSIKQYLSSDWHAMTTIVGQEEYSFLTCDGINLSLSYAFYASPFDIWSWTLIALIITFLTGIFLAVRCIDIVFYIMVLSFVLTERPIEFLERFWLQKHCKLKFLLILWSLGGLLLSNFYKSFFTSEITLPIKATAIYREFKDLENFTIYAPIKQEISFLSLYDSIEGVKMLPQFFEVIMTLLRSKVPEISEFANNILASYDESSHINTLLRPLSYHRPSHFWGNLTKENCKKRAYIDTTENVKRVLEYVNEKKTTIFNKGTEHLRLNYIGWYFRAVYMDTRLFKGIHEKLEIIISSGIYNYWKNLYDRFRSPKLFKDYEENGIIFEGGTGVLSSNLLSAFVIYLGLSFSALVLFANECCVKSLKIVTDRLKWGKR